MCLLLSVSAATLQATETVNKKEVEMVRQQLDEAKKATQEAEKKVGRERQDRQAGMRGRRGQEA